MQVASKPAASSQPRRTVPKTKLPVLSANLYGETYPASWFAVAPSGRLGRRGRMAVDAFGERLVVWRDASGEAHVQQRFCPHMGASLACGDVEGDRIVCPFHRWEWDRDGACARIPYMDAAKIPKRARIQTFPVVEQCGFIWAFNGKEPTHGLPPLPEYGAKGFGIRTKTQRFDAHPLLILENGCDAQHFKYVHKVDFERYEVDVLEDAKHGFAFDVRQWVALPSPVGGTSLITTSIRYVGASLIYGRLKRNEDLLATFIAAPTPVGPKATDFTLIVAVKSLPWFLAPLNPVYYSFLARQLFTGATDDYFPIWKEMDTSYRGVLVDEDRLQQRFRRYYRAHLRSNADSSAQHDRSCRAGDEPRAQFGE
jgi:phenylpropionate dioxygenase-like ring-hydroxylating dioxygenase large terminal subunit